MKSNIGWQDVYHEVDSSEAMKSHVSDQIKNKQEQTAFIQQLERNIEENKIDKETNQTEMNALEKDIVSDENYEKKNNITIVYSNYKRRIIYIKNERSF